MRSRRFLLASLAVTLACASAPASQVDDPGPHGDSRTITLADLDGATQLNLQDFIVATHPQWLRDARGRIADVTVFLDDTRLGGLSTLSSVSLNTVGLVRYYDASAAQQKFNSIVGPVIQILKR